MIYNLFYKNFKEIEVFIINMFNYEFGNTNSKKKEQIVCLERKKRKKLYNLYCTIVKYLYIWGHFGIYTRTVGE